MTTTEQIRLEPEPEEGSGALATGADRTEASGGRDQTEASGGRDQTEASGGRDQTEASGGEDRAQTSGGAARTALWVEVPGAVLSVVAHGHLAGATASAPPLVVTGSPMDSTGFGTLVSLLQDRVVVTVDPRNTGRSTREDPTAPVTAEQHGADLHAVVQALGVGQVDLFGSSGGATNGLALVQQHPGDVRVLVAHEPPLAALLPDAAVLVAAIDAVVRAYDDGGAGPAMARFIALMMRRGALTPDVLGEAPPDPAAFGLPTDDDGRRDDPLMANMRGGGVGWRPDLGALRAAPTRVVVAVGRESGGRDDGEIAGRAAHALASALGVAPVIFPGGHGGFLGGEYGQTGEPVAFADTLRRVLADG